MRCCSSLLPTENQCTHTVVSRKDWRNRFAARVNSRRSTSTLQHLPTGPSPRHSTHLSPRSSLARTTCNRCPPIVCPGCLRVRARPPQGRGSRWAQSQGTEGADKSHGTEGVDGACVCPECEGLEVGGRLGEGMRRKGRLVLRREKGGTRNTGREGDRGGKRVRGRKEEMKEKRNGEGKTFRKKL